MAYVDEDMAVIKSYSDISDDYVALNELVERCNRYKLDPLHMEDIIEDFLE